MKRFAALTVLVGSLFASQAHAVYNMMLVGTLMSYDEKAAVIKQRNNSTVRVPRHSVGDVKGYITGKATITVFVSPSEFLAMNPTK